MQYTPDSTLVAIDIIGVLAKHNIRLNSVASIFDRTNQLLQEQEISEYAGCHIKYENGRRVYPK